MTSDTLLKESSEDFTCETIDVSEYDEIHVDADNFVRVSGLTEEQYQESDTSVERDTPLDTVKSVDLIIDKDGENTSATVEDFSIATPSPEGTWFAEQFEGDTDVDPLKQQYSGSFEFDINDQDPETAFLLGKLFAKGECQEEDTSDESTEDESEKSVDDDAAVEEARAEGFVAGMLFTTMALAASHGHERDDDVTEREDHTAEWSEFFDR